jgi:hypothetical protein
MNFAKRLKSIKPLNFIWSIFTIHYSWEIENGLKLILVTCLKGQVTKKHFTIKGEKE